MATNAADPAEAASGVANAVENGSENAAPKACAHNPAFQQLQQPEPGCKCGKLRPPRKLHAVIGLWLLLFMSLHLAIAVTGINPSRYQGAVDRLHRSLAYLPGAVLLLVFLPVLLQTASGLYLTAKEGMQYDIKRCDRGGKLRFFLQRWSGLAIVAYLLVHVSNMHGWLPLARQWNAAQAASPHGTAFLHTAFAFRPWHSPAANSITIAFLLAGILCTVFHAANGAWSGAILWKVVASPRSKTCFGYLCAVAGLALAAMGAVAWYAFTLSPNVQATLAITGR